CWVYFSSCIYPGRLCQGNDNFGFANGDVLAALVLRPAFNGDGCLPASDCNILHEAATGERIAQAHHTNGTHFETGEQRLRIRGYLPGNVLAEKGHAQHTMSDDAIKSHTMRGLFIEMNGVGVARCCRITVQLLLPDGRFDHCRKLLTNDGI